MKIGLFFGSFNPIHTGHLIIAEHIINYFTEKVWFVVSPQNPFKTETELLDVHDRLSMIKAAIVDNHNFEASDVELKLPVPSYTIDTLIHLKKIYPGHDFFCIMGSDNFLNISKWKSADILLRDYKFLIYKRAGFNIESHKLNMNVILLEAPLINISSTQLRDLIKAKKSVRYMIPEAVLKLIRENKFYV